MDTTVATRWLKVGVLVLGVLFSIAAIEAQSAGFIQVGGPYRSPVTGQTTPKFGVSVALSADGTKLLVGETGRVHQYNVNPIGELVYTGAWNSPGDFEDASLSFGGGVRLSANGSLQLVAAFVANSEGGMVFLRNTAAPNNVVVFQENLESTNDMLFGISIDMTWSADVVCIGAAPVTAEGRRLRCYFQTGPFSYTESASGAINETDAGLEEFSQFPSAIVLAKETGEYLAATGPRYDNDAGAVAIFKRTSNSYVWHQTLGGTVVDAVMGISVAMTPRGDVLALGGTGVIHVFSLSGGSYSAVPQVIVQADVPGASEIFGALNLALSADGLLLVFIDGSSEVGLTDSIVYSLVRNFTMDPFVLSGGGPTVVSGPSEFALNDRDRITLDASGNTLVLGTRTFDNENGAVWVLRNRSMVTSTLQPTMATRSPTTSGAHASLAFHRLALASYVSLAVFLSLVASF